MNEPRKAKRIFSPEQKAAIVHQIETDVKGGMKLTAAVEKQAIAYSMFSKWKRQLQVAVKSSLRNGKAPLDKDKKQMEQRIARLERLVLSQAQTIADLKKETSWD
jgi:transposase-like protein